MKRWLCEKQNKIEYPDRCLRMGFLIYNENKPVFSHLNNEGVLNELPLSNRRLQVYKVQN